MFKTLVIALLILIFISLVSGLVFLVKDSGKSNRVAKSLTWRIGLSILLFIVLMLAYYFSQG